MRTGNRFHIRTVKKVAKNATATLTAQELGKGVITSTSAAATSLTLPTAVKVIGHLKAKRGDNYPFIVDNSAGASIVTLVVATGIVAAPAVITGGATLTVAVGSVGFFKIYFTSPTAALLYRTS